MWKVLNKEVDLGEPTSFFDQVFFGLYPKRMSGSKVFVDDQRNMFESRMSVGGVENCLTILTIIITCSPFFSQQSTIDYSYCRCGGAELFSTYSYSRGRGTELFSNSGYSRGRGTERP